MEKKEFKVGDKVFDIQRGNGIVENLVGGSSGYVVEAAFKTQYGVNYKTYTVDGFEMKTHKLPSLYHGHDLIVEVKEPVYVYQAMFRYPVDDVYRYALTHGFWSSKEAFMSSEYNGYEFVELYEPSKRLVTT